MVRPMYQKFAHDLGACCEAWDLRTGDRLPAEFKFWEWHSVPRDTVWRMLKELECLASAGIRLGPATS